MLHRSRRPMVPSVRGLRGQLHDPDQPKHSHRGYDPGEAQG